MAKGFFIAIEGPDGCGKSTQINYLAENLKSLGYDVVLTREPGGTKLGEEVRKLLLLSKEGNVSPYAELLLFEAARAQHVEEVLKPALEAGKIVIASRYADATRAYQGKVKFVFLFSFCGKDTFFSLFNHILSHLINRNRK